MDRNNSHARVTRRVFLLILTGVLTLSGAVALAGSAVCNGCTNAQYKNKAISLGWGTHYIVDYENDILKKYWVTYEGDFHQWHAASLVVEQDYLDATSILSRIYEETNGTMKVTGVVDAPASAVGSVSGWTLNGNGAAADVVSNWLGCCAANQWGNLFTIAEVGIVSIASGVIHIFTSVDPTEIIRVRFDDGSTSDFEYNFWDTVTGLDIHPILGSSRDSYGNIIPFDPADVDGEHPFDYRFAGSNPTDPSRMSGVVHDLIGSGTVFYVSHAYICNPVCHEIF